MKIVSHARTETGHVRKSNQDAMAVDDGARLYLVCDGMGGHAGGEIAAELCCQFFQEFVAEEIRRKNSEFEDNPGSLIHPDFSVYRLLTRAFNHASKLIFERSLEDPNLKGMGTTASAFLVVGDHAYWAHVGDSRIFLVRAGVLYQMSEDHSYVAEQVRAGLLTEEEALGHQLGNVITRSIGFQEEEDIDVGCFRLELGDLVFLTSDGFHGKIQPKSWVKLVSDEGVTIRDCVDALMGLALELAGDDNITVVGAHVLA